ncbi:MAG: isoprenylcysteine carboxyl methyltransferase family protein [Bradymonadia bacterium]
MLYALFIGLTALERLVEMVVSTRNARWSLEQGGVETGQGHYPYMVALHTGFLVACVLEHFLLPRSVPTPAVVTLLALALMAQGLRWWVITTLGRQWNTRVIVIPGAPRVARGPFTVIKHPNYVAVVLEGVVIPLLGGAWITAVVFTVLNGWLLTVRIRCENEALSRLEAARVA